MNKNNLSNSVIRLLESIGVKEYVKYYVTKVMDYKLHNQIRKAIARNNETENAQEGSQDKKVLFFTLQGRPNMLVVMAGLLGQSLNLRGAQSELILCNGILPVCDLPFVTNNSKILCKGCRTAARKLSGSFDLPSHFLGDFINVKSISKAETLVNNLEFDDYFDFKYLSVEVGKHVYASVLRYLLRGSIEDDDYTRKICREYMKSAVMMVDISKSIVDKIKPDCVVMHHGIYFTTGIFAEYAKKHNIHVVVFTPAYRKSTYLFSHNETYHKTLQDERPENWENLEFSEKDGEMLDSYLDSRRYGSQDFISYHPNPFEDREKIIKELNLDKNRKVIGMFTSICWDGQVVFHDSAFNNMFEWIDETIKYFIKKPDIQLVIRAHPAEVKGPVETRQKVCSEIKKHFPALPENIKIIDSTSDISTYTLSDIIDTAIVYTTKVGLEFSVKGIPVIVAGEAFYRNKGFTFDARSTAEYISLLDNITNYQKDSPELIAKARKYAHYYFFRRFIPFDYTKNRTWNNVTGLKIDKLNDLMPGKDKYLDLICDGILNNRNFVID